MFKALMLEEKDGKVVSSIQKVDEAKLPEGDVTVAVSHSTLNYKDGLILLGQGRLVRQYPHIPGVDFAGKVLESAHQDCGMAADGAQGDARRPRQVRPPRGFRGGGRRHAGVRRRTRRRDAGPPRIRRRRPHPGADRQLTPTPA